MSQISVVHYTPPINKINVLQQNNISNKQNDRQVIVLRKPQQILPQSKEFNKDDILLTNTAKKKPKSGKDLKTSPQPVSVARRNARERNRVKQVNNGFANLRQHIPAFISAAFETNNGRGGNKKLSKVETLRMAVEYIRSLEDILAMDNDQNDTSETTSHLVYPSPSSCPSPNHLNQNQLSYAYQVLSPPAEDDELSSATPPPQQFIKINTTTNTYSIIPSTAFENGENLDPLVVHEQLLSDPSLLDTNLDFNVNSQELSYLSSINTTSSLSPGFYSDSSLSPIHDVKSDPNSYMTVYNTPPEERMSPCIITVKTEESDVPVISLKTEHELSNDQKENIVDVLEWWEQQPHNVGS